MKQRLRSLISQGKTAQALEELIRSTRSDRDLHDQAIALSARFEKYTLEKNGGTADPANLDIELNRIHAHALALIGSLSGPASSSKPGTWKKIAFWIGMLASIAAIAGYTLKDVLMPVEEKVGSTPIPPPPDSSSLVAAPSDTLPIIENKTAPSTGKVKVEVNDEGKVGNVITGDSNYINIKQDF